MKSLLISLLAALALPACATEVIYETPELAWNECISWMKEGGEFYIQEGSDYNMVTWSFPRRRCFYSEDKMEILGKELIICLSICLYFPTINLTGSNNGENLKNE